MGMPQGTVNLVKTSPSGDTSVVRPAFSTRDCSELKQIDLSSAPSCHLVQLQV